MTSMAMQTSAPDFRTWPRIFWVTSPDLKTWSEATWAEPYGIDPHLYKDPATGKAYLSLMGLNNRFDAVWGISQCQVNLQTGKCLGPYRNIWNGTLPVTASTRPEGPKIFKKDAYYYLLIAEGGTGATHRASIARSASPEGPWETSPTNPLIFNGALSNLTVSATGHATFTDTPDGRWFATFLARRNVRNWSPLGRETFFAPVTWDEDGWPKMNGGELVLPSQRYDFAPDQEYPAPPFVEDFSGSELAKHWYQLRTPYWPTYRLGSSAGNGNASGVVFEPNVYTLSDRDTPAAIMRKQKSLNMTFKATLLPIEGGALGPYQSVGVSVYQTEVNHQDVGIKGCSNTTGLCFYHDSYAKSPGPGSRPTATTEWPLNTTTISDDFKLHIRAEPLRYRMGYSVGKGDVTWAVEFLPSVVPAGFDGAMLTLYASGNGFPWPFDAPDVGFSRIEETYYEENLPDYNAGW